MLRKLLSVVCLFWAIGVQAVDAPEVSAEVVNHAGEQRMFSQRLAKAYVQLGLEILPASALEQLRDSIVQFELNLERIRPTAERLPAAAQAFARLGSEWRALRVAADVAITRESALEVSRRSEDVLAAAESLVQALARERGMEGLRVNRAGRQRMLSQRLAKAFLLYAWGVDAEQSRREMEAAMREFDAGLSALVAEAGKSRAETAELEEISLQWEWLRTALEVEGAISYRLIVVEAADSILTATDRLARLYVQESASTNTQRQGGMQ